MIKPIKIDETKEKSPEEVREETRAHLRTYAGAAVAVQKRNAAAAKKTEAIARELAEANADDLATMATASMWLGMIAKVYRIALFPGKARKFDGDTAVLALQKKSEVEIEDPWKLAEFAMENGYDDLIKTVRTPQKPAIKARLQAGEVLPGCALIESENINIKLRADLGAEPEDA
jgi:hypothetical protein